MNRPTPSRKWRLRSLVATAALLILAGCSGETTDSLADGDSAPTTTLEAEGAPEDSTTTAAPTAESTPSEPELTPNPDADTESQPPPPPVEAFDGPVPEPTGNEVVSAWISRRFMTADAIEVTWSAPEGADTYAIHRIQSDLETPPSADELTATNQIHSGDAVGVFLDDEVTAETRYWYGIQSLDDDGSPLSVGWHRAVAVDDEVPPAPVEITLEQTNGAVQLSWNQPDENFELHAYRILRSVEGSEPEVVATTWNTDQTSFIDNTPPTGALTYFVSALDFHWNESERTEVSVTIS